MIYIIIFVAVVLYIIGHLDHKGKFRKKNTLLQFPDTTWQNEGWLEFHCTRRQLIQMGKIEPTQTEIDLWPELAHLRKTNEPKQ